MTHRVLCAGLIVGDFLVKPVEGMPEKGRMVPVDRTELHLGGCAVNTGVVLKRIGVDVAIAGKVGRDNLGKFILDTLAGEGVNIRGITVAEGVTTSGTSVLVHRDGERSFLHSIGANARFSLQDVNPDFLKEFSILHVAGALLMPAMDGRPLADLMRTAREMGKVTCLDTAWDVGNRWFSLLKDALPFVDYFLPSIEEARMITGRKEPDEIARFLLDAGVGNVGLKMGENGSFLMNAGQRHAFPPLKIAVVDTTGCGDAYAAGFIAGLTRGFSFEQCGLLANLTGAKIATCMGATSGVRSWEDLAAFGKEHGYRIGHPAA